MLRGQTKNQQTDDRAVEADLEKKTALGNMLQEVARSLQTENKQLQDQLDVRCKQAAAEVKCREELECLVQQIKDRSATHTVVAGAHISRLYPGVMQPRNDGVQRKECTQPPGLVSKLCQKSGISNGYVCGICMHVCVVLCNPWRGFVKEF